MASTSTPTPGNSISVAIDIDMDSEETLKVDHPHSSKDSERVTEGLAEGFIRAIDDPVKLQDLLIDSYRKCISLEKVREEVRDDEEQSLSSVTSVPSNLQEMQEMADSINAVFKEELFKKVYEAVEQDLSCSICSEVFIQPTYIECGHTFCNHCIRQWSHDRVPKQCPMCRKSFRRPLVKHLEVDNFISKIHSLLSPEIQTSREELVRGREQTVANAPYSTTSPISANSIASESRSFESMYLSHVRALIRERRGRMANYVLNPEVVASGSSGTSRNIPSSPSIQSIFPIAGSMDEETLQTYNNADDNSRHSRHVGAGLMNLELLTRMEEEEAEMASREDLERAQNMTRASTHIQQQGLQVEAIRARRRREARLSAAASGLNSTDSVRSRTTAAVHSAGEPPALVQLHQRASARRMRPSPPSLSDRRRDLRRMNIVQNSNNRYIENEETDTDDAFWNLLLTSTYGYGVPEELESPRQSAGTIYSEAHNRNSASTGAQTRRTGNPSIFDDALRRTTEEFERRFPPVRESVDAIPSAVNILNSVDTEMPYIDGTTPTTHTALG